MLDGDQQTLDLSERPVATLYRRTDPTTSALAAAKLTSRQTHLRVMLSAFAQHGDLTDVEAANIAGLERVEATRRASELRATELIEPVTVGGKVVTRLLPSNRPGMVCRITRKGLTALGEAA